MKEIAFLDMYLWTVVLFITIFIVACLVNFAVCFLGIKRGSRGKGGLILNRYYKNVGRQ